LGRIVIAETGTKISVIDWESLLNVLMRIEMVFEADIVS
jgi:hypothetical protein